MKSTILEKLTGSNQDAQIPHICHCTAPDGFALAIALADEGNRVIVFSQRSLVHYRRHISGITIIEDDIETTRGFAAALEVLKEGFDVIVFVCEQSRFAEPVITTDAEFELIAVHLWNIIHDTDRIFSFHQDKTSDNVVLLDPPTLDFSRLP